MLLFFRQMFLPRAPARACVRACVCVVHWHCTAQLSMFNMEKRFRNKTIIIIIMERRGVLAIDEVVDRMGVLAIDERVDRMGVLAIDERRMIVLELWR